MKPHLPQRDPFRFSLPTRLILSAPVGLLLLDELWTLAHADGHPGQGAGAILWLIVTVGLGGIWIWGLWRRPF